MLIAFVAVLLAVITTRHWTLPVAPSDGGTGGHSTYAAIEGDGYDHLHYDKKEFKVIKVVDGDTLDIDVFDRRNNTPHTRVRLWGVDTPETQHSHNGKMYYGPEASRFTTNMVQGKTVSIILEPTKRTRCKYGRLLAYVYLLDNTMLNEKLLTGGYAYADERFAHMFKKRFATLQKQAQSQKQGLWKSARPQDWPQWYRRRHENSYKSN